MAEALFEHLLICGVGLLGGSLGMAARRAGIAARVSGWGRSPEHLALAESLGAIDQGVTDLAAAAGAADCLVLATPVGAFEGLLRTIRGTLRPGAIVTDVGSVKEAVLRWANILPEHATFIGGHPMAGKERAGVQAADPDLFRGARWVLCPAGRSPRQDAALERLQRMVRRLGAAPLVLPAAPHDRAVAAMSHLPQAASAALMLAAEQLELQTPGAFRLAAGGFRDTTRLAASDAGMWRDVFLHNARPVADAIATLERRLAELREAIQRGDGPLVESILAAAKRAKDRQVRQQEGPEP